MIGCKIRSGAIAALAHLHRPQRRVQGRALPRWEGNLRCLKVIDPYDPRVASRPKFISQRLRISCTTQVLVDWHLAMHGCS
jgi:hypothetical protein